MFPSANTPRRTAARTAPRLIGALRLVRSFLLLEDDYDVDWEVDQDERRHGLGVVDGPFADGAATGEWRPWSPLDRQHPHRRSARVQLGERRPGSVAAREQVCACPLPAPGGRAPVNQRGTTPVNQSRTTAGRPVGGPHV
jgi:hypothetical protein